ncbi:MAG: type II secretion system secretin GspD [Bdellovibrionales bacterium]|nr:type II secretion system secretin GspD [Bdellovibrionales bacterium]
MKWILFICFMLFPFVSMSQEKVQKKGAVSGIPLNEASIDDIDSENFPDIIKSFDYPNADIGDIVKAMSKLTGINFIIDTNIKGKISIVAPSPITVAEAFQAFLSALSINGYALVRSGAFWKVISADKASRDNVQVYKGEYFPDADQYITKIFKLKHANVKVLEKHLKQFLSDKNSKALFYEEANTIIVSDYGSTIEKVSQIIKELDIPNVYTQLEVVPIQHAAAIDLTNKLHLLITNRASTSRRRPVTRSGSRPGSNLISSTQANTSGVSALIPDERTNSIIISGTKDGIKKVKNLIKKLDIKFDSQAAGGIFVYYVKYGVAEEIEKTLNSILQTQAPSAGKNAPRNVRQQFGLQNLFGSPSGMQDTIRVSHDKNTNSLLITAKRHHYQILKSILDKIDIPKNQVFIKTIIMDLNAEDGFDWDITTYKFLKDGKGQLSGILPRIGFSSHSFTDLMKQPGNESVLGFSADFVNVGPALPLLGLLKEFKNVGAIPGDDSNKATKGVDMTEGMQIPSLMTFVNALKKQTGGNILSTPQIIAIDNEPSSISVGVNAAVGVTQTQQTAGPNNFYYQPNHIRQDIFTTLKITPYINPDGKSVRMQIEQKIDSLSPTTDGPALLTDSTRTITKREIKTNIILDDQETAVLGGLMHDEELDTVNKIPILGDIPILGWLFSAREKKKKKKNLIVFITPKIIKTAQDKADILRDQVDQRVEFIKTFMNNRDNNEAEVQKILSQTPPKRTEETAVAPPNSFQTEQEIVIEDPADNTEIEEDTENPENMTEIEAIQSTENEDATEENIEGFENPEEEEMENTEGEELNIEENIEEVIPGLFDGIDTNSFEEIDNSEPAAEENLPPNDNFGNIIDSNAE